VRQVQRFTDKNEHNRSCWYACHLKITSDLRSVVIRCQCTWEQIAFPVNKQLGLPLHDVLSSVLIRASLDGG
jgi:hypothetical protein